MRTFKNSVIVPPPAGSPRKRGEPKKQDRVPPAGRGNLKEGVKIDPIFEHPRLIL
jgi:hypothetical protein